MKVWIAKLTVVLCSALMLTLSAQLSFAGPKKTPRLKVTKLPRVALPQAKPPSVAPAPVVTSALERAVTAKVAVPAALPTAAALPASVQKNFLTGPQVLAAYMPGWRSELRYQVFDDAQLDVIEQTFKEADATLFKLDENGNWLAPADGSTTWEYERWFAMILAESPVKFGDAQIKTLFGKFARFDDVFTRLNHQAFLLVNKREPNPNAPGEEGKLARHIKYNLAKRDGRKMNSEVEGYVYGNMPAKLQTPTPSYGPKGRAPARTPEQVWEEVTQFMREHGRIPSQTSEDDYERKLRKAWDKIYQTKQTSNDPFVVRLIKLHKETVREKAANKTPQEIWESTLRFMQEHNGKLPSRYSTDPVEKSLHLAGRNIWRQHKNDTLEELDKLDEYTRKIVELFKENVKEIATPKTPQEIWESTLLFMQEHDGEMPSEHSTDPVEKSLRKAGNKIWLKHKNDTPEELAQLDEYTRKIVELFKENVKEIATPKTPQEVLEGILLFMQEHNGKMPSEDSTDPVEKSLRNAGNKIYYPHKNDTPEELAQLGEYTRKIVELFRENVRENKTPQEVLEGILLFMQEHNGKMPSEYSTDPVEKSLRWAGNRIWQQHKNDTPQELAQLDEYTRQIVELFRKNVRGYTKKDKE